MTTQPTRPTRYRDLDWEKDFEPLYGSPIHIPEDVLLWRGYDMQYEPISERFSYFSSRDIATSYAQKPNHTLGCFVTTKELKLLDICFMRHILRRIIQMNNSDPNINDFVSTMISFGLCSLGHQILLLNERYKELLQKSTKNSQFIQECINEVRKTYDSARFIEQEGVRVAETTNDGQTMSFLKGLFEDHFDGFISPRLHTPFHIEKEGQFNPEIILFNPNQVQLKKLPIFPNRVPKLLINRLIENGHRLIIVDPPGKNVFGQFYMNGGGNVPIYNSKYHPHDEITEKLNKNHKKSIEEYTKANNAGKQWNQKLRFVNRYAPSPAVAVTKFTSNHFTLPIEERPKMLI